MQRCNSASLPSITKVNPRLKTLSSRNSSFSDLSYRATPMPTLTASASPRGRSGSRIQKVKHSQKHRTAQTPVPVSGAAITDQHWPALVNEASAFSDHNEGPDTGQIPARPSSSESCSLACPYAKLNSLLAIQTARENGKIDRPRCWSKSYANISRLKYAKVLPETSFRSRVVLTIPSHLQ